MLTTREPTFAQHVGPTFIQHVEPCNVCTTCWANVYTTCWANIYTTCTTCWANVCTTCWANIFWMSKVPMVLHRATNVGPTKIAAESPMLAQLPLAIWVIFVGLKFCGFEINNEFVDINFQMFSDVQTKNQTICHVQINNCFYSLVLTFRPQAFIRK